jgi:hypothetical protein
MPACVELDGALEVDGPAGGTAVGAGACLLGLSKTDLTRYCLLSWLMHESSVRSTEKTYLLLMILWSAGGRPAATASGLMIASQFFSTISFASSS